MTKQEILAVAKPILFNADMVRAILDGRKTVTRRVMKHKGTLYDGETLDEWARRWNVKPPYHAGDYLYVRETWRPVSATVDFWERGDPTAVDDGFGFQYRAGGEIAWRGDFNPHDDEFHSTEIRCGEKWRPSIHMPKEAARIFLRVTGVRVERLQDIAEEQAQAEGAKMMTTPNIPDAGRTYRQGFGELRNSTIKPADLPLYGWKANPRVWVIEFEKVEVIPKWLST